LSTTKYSKQNTAFQELDMFPPSNEMLGKHLLFFSRVPFSYTVNCYVYLVFVTDGMMLTRKTKILRDKPAPSQCCCVYYKYDTDWLVA
jgi:hypothetical protein